VASESRLAARAGIDALDAGGNAIDAAAATVFAAGVTRPDLCGIGGGGFLVYRSARGRTAALDFREKAPSSYQFGSGLLVSGAPPPLFGTGHNVVGVPGTVAGMAEAVRRHGRRPLSAAIAPAEKLAREGYPVSGELSTNMTIHASRLALFPESARVYLKNGSTPYSPGERLVLKDYADSLGLIARDGPQALYAGPIGQRIADDMSRSGGLPGDRGTMTRADLAAYGAPWRAPLVGRYRGYTVIAMPPPTSGGLALIEILNILEGVPLRSFGQSSADHLHYLAEAQKIAWADRNRYVGDPDFVRVPVGAMTSKDYAAGRRAEIARDRAATYGPKAGGDEPGGHTTHVAVMDAAGNAVSVTCTIEQPFGSAVVAPGTGFLLNNQLTDFDGPGTANEPKPGKRPRSSTSPTIVARRGASVMALGAAGGASIPMGVTSAVIGVVDFGLDIARAVDAERADARGRCEGSGLQLCIEDARLAPGVADSLRARGHAVTSRSPEFCRGMGPGCEYWIVNRVQAVGLDPAGGVRLAISDPRNEGATGAEAGLGALGQAGGPLPPRIRLAVRPRTVRVGRLTRFRFRATVVRGGRPVAVRGATVNFAALRRRTDRRGRAAITVRLLSRRRRPGPRRARATRRDLRPGVAIVRVVR
jgi:gamma-glutamyltranspeptidase/glutathione hydrolase